MPINNFGSLTFGYRGAQPDAPYGFTALQGIGIKTVVKLNDDGLDSEREACDRMGIHLIPAPLKMFGNSTGTIRAIVDRIDAAKSVGPVFVHCTHGRDRTGMVCAAYRMVYDKWTQQQAFAEREAYGVSGFVIEAANVELTQILKDIAAGK
jgi:tyrosine-protein phosphatase SIW14